MKLPIELVKGSNPPRFVWRQEVSTPVGHSVVIHSETVQPILEGALVELVNIAKEQEKEIVKLRNQIKGHVDRIAAQSDLLTRKAEVQLAPQPTPQQPIKKGK